MDKYPLHPFGCLVWYLPEDPVGAAERAKFDPRGAPALFFGHVIQRGGRWRGDSYLVDLRDAARVRYHDAAGWRQVHIKRIKGVWRDLTREIQFPLVAPYRRAMETLDGWRQADQYDGVSRLSTETR